jgi:S1-C subfamily serine protease
MAKRIVILGFLIICALAAQAEQSEKVGTKPTRMTLPEAIEFVRPSVVQISARIDPPRNPNGPIQIPGRPTISPIGTGFMVNAEGYVITARHVVEFFQSLQVPGNKRLLIGVAVPNLDNVGGLSIRGSFAEVDCDIVEEDALHDVALIKMKQNPFTGGMGTFMKTPTGSIGYLHKVAFLSPDRPRDGEHIAVSGYPLSSTVLITTSGSVASAWAFRTEQSHPENAPTGFMMPTTIDSYLVDMHVNHGNSGGPVYSVEDGAVIGICVSINLVPVEHSANTNPTDLSLSFNSGLANVVPTRYIIDLLKKHDLKWTEKKSAKDHVKPASAKRPVAAH